MRPHSSERSYLEHPTRSRPASNLAVDEVLPMFTPKLSASRKAVPRFVEAEP
jgi:hypothetical protein